jgi:hypothetical protein
MATGSIGSVSERDEDDSIWADELTPSVAGFTLGLLLLAAGGSAILEPRSTYRIFLVREITAGAVLLLMAWGGYRVTGFRRVPALLAVGSMAFVGAAYVGSAVPGWSADFAWGFLVAGGAGVAFGAFWTYRVFAADLRDETQDEGRPSAEP